MDDLCTYHFEHWASPVASHSSTEDSIFSA